MSAKDKTRKKIAPTLLSELPVADNTGNAFNAAAQKKNPLANTADLIAMRYGVSNEAPQINEEAFEKNRNVGKKITTLKDYFKQTADVFVKNEAEKKEVATKKRKANAKLTPCERKRNTLQRNLDSYIKVCDRNFSNESLITMADLARTKLAKNSSVKGGSRIRMHLRSYKHRR